MKQRMQAYWWKLQAREKIVILSGAGLVAAIALLLLFNSLWQTRIELQLERESQVAQVQWLEEQAQLAAQMGNNCLDRRIMPLTNREVLTLLADRNQLEMVQLDSAAGAGVEMQVNSADGNSILRFLHQGACQGFQLISLEIEAGANGEGYSGQVEMSRDS